MSVYVCVSVSIQYLKDDISTSTSNMLVFIYKSGAQVFTKLGIFIYNRNKETYLEHEHAGACARTDGHLDKPQPRNVQELIFSIKVAGVNETID